MYWFRYGIGILLLIALPAHGLDIYIDNLNTNNTAGTFSILSGGTSGSNGWQTASTATNRYLTNYRTRRTISAGGSTGECEWRPTLPTAGNWQVFVWYPTVSGASTSAPYVVDYNGGSTTVNVNQTVNQGQWVSIGTFNFLAGTTGRVRLNNNTTGTLIVADAVRFFDGNSSVVLTMAVSPAGGGTTTPAAGTSNRTVSEVVPLTATPASGYTFTGWSVSAGSNVANPASASTTVTMDVAKTVTANFFKPEFRGMWITRFEWPSTVLSTVQNNINTYLQKLADNGFNAAIFQMRGQADTLYPSPYEPWSPIVSSDGNTPAGWGTFDPMQYAIDAAHSRGLEFHAYINTHVAWQSSTATPPVYANHLYYQHCDAATPGRYDWLVHDASGVPAQYGESNYVWMAPGVPEFQAYWRRQVMHVVNTYNVDGVHFDRIRTPGSAYSHDPISEARLAGEGNPAGLAFAEWTRNQTTRLLCDLYAQIMEVKPQIKISSSPLGLYWGPRYSQYGYPQTDCGYQYGYSCVYQDAQAWLAAGAMDFIVPQIYWADPPTRTTNPNFSEVLPDWVANNAGRHVYAGSTTSNHAAADLVNEINAARNLGANGNVVFSYSSVNANNYWNAYASGPYAQASPTPVMPWKVNPTTGIIIGNVVGADGVTPVVDAQLQRGGSNYTALSSGDGLYSFLLVPPGTYSVTCNKSGLGSRTITNVVVTAGQVTRVNISYASTVPPTVTQHPSNQTLCPGTTATFSVQATGSGTLTYRWQKNQRVLLSDDARITGSTTPTLQIAQLTAADAGFYRCIVTNGTSANSDNAELVVRPATQVTQQPTLLTNLCPGAGAQFTVAGTGEGTVTYTWQKDGQPITDAVHYQGINTATLTIPVVAAGDAGAYRCVVTAGCGEAISDPATLGVSPDSDNDGVADCLDGCPADPAKTSPGFCGCGVSDVDSDEDTVPDCGDMCPHDLTKVSPGPCGCGVPDTDTDGDSTPDCLDGCPSDPAKTAPGACGCGTADIDTDGDTVPDCLDNCPNVSNTGQSDRNNNSVGDACEPARTIVAWRSVRSHSGVGPIGITLNASASGNGTSGPSVESRSGGVQLIEVEFDGAVSLVDANPITVTGQTTPVDVMEAPVAYAPTSVTLAAPNMLQIAFAPGVLPNRTCYAISIGATAIGENLTGDADCSVRSLVADTNGTGDVSLGDMLLTKNQNGQPIATAARHDVNLNGIVNLGDSLAVKANVTSPLARALCP